ncbi:binding--dependent transport system inner membrane component family protein, partial [Vibrio cholerae CP1044(17)]
MHEPSQALKL